MAVTPTEIFFEERGLSSKQPRAMNKLQSRFESGVDQLVAIFKDIGYCEEERQRVLESLTERVIAVIDKVVEEQDQTRGQLEKQIEDTANSIHQMSAALGKNAPEMEVFDDMSLKQMLRNYQVQEGKLAAEKKQAMRELKSEWNTLHALWSELGTPRDPAEYDASINVFDPNGEFQAVDENKLGSKTAQRYRLMVQHWQAERDKRAATVTSLRELIEGLETQLEEPGMPEMRDLPPCGFERIRTLQDRVDELEQLRDSRAKAVAARWAELEALYELLETPAAERLAAPGTNLGRRTLEAAEREAVRVRALKSAKMRELVSRAASDLRATRAELGLEDDNDMDDLLSGDATEETLNALQKENESLRAVLASCRQITELIPRREELRLKAAEVRARQADPARLTSKRGGCSLLEEQRMEAKVRRELPPLEARMLALIERWEAAQGREFRWQGRSYANVIREDQDSDNAAVRERKDRLAARKLGDQDQSMTLDRSMANSSIAPVASVSRSMTVAPRATQSARPVTKTRPRTLATPTNVAARTTSVSVSRATAPSSAAAGSSMSSRQHRRERPETTPVAKHGTKKYSKVKSRIDTGLKPPSASSSRAQDENAAGNQMRIKL